MVLLALYVSIPLFVVNASADTMGNSLLISSVTGLSLLETTMRSVSVLGLLSGARYLSSNGNNKSSSLGSTPIFGFGVDGMPAMFGLPLPTEISDKGKYRGKAPVYVAVLSYSGWCVFMVQSNLAATELAYTFSSLNYWVLKADAAGMGAFLSSVFSTTLASQSVAAHEQNHSRLDYPHNFIGFLTPTTAALPWNVALKNASVQFESINVATGVLLLDRDMHFINEAEAAALAAKSKAKSPDTKA
jgi:hypothetical protein